MRARFLPTATLVWLLAAVSNGQALLDPATLQLVPTDAGLLVGVEWRRVLASATGAAIQKGLQESGFSAAGPFDQIGRVLTEDIDSILLAASAAELAKPGQQMNALVVVRGRFHPAQVRQWFPGKSETAGGVELFAPANGKPPTTRFAVLDAGTLLFGERREVVAAIRRKSAPAPGGAASRLLQRAGGLSAGNDIWIVLEAPPGGFQPPAAPKGQAAHPAAQLLAEVTGLDLGLSFTGGFQLQANLQAKSEAAAQNLGTAVQGLMAIAAMNSQDPPAAEMLQKTQVAHRGSEVQISLRLTEAEMAQSLSRLPSARAGAAGRPARPAEPRRAEPGKIRIVGADSGPVEIPVNPAR
jgi:hypothetical protein